MTDVTGTPSENGSNPSRTAGGSASTGGGGGSVAPERATIPTGGASAGSSGSTSGGSAGSSTGGSTGGGSSAGGASAGGSSSTGASAAGRTGGAGNRAKSAAAKPAARSTGGDSTPSDLGTSTQGDIASPSAAQLNEEDSVLVAGLDQAQVRARQLSDWAWLRQEEARDAVRTHPLVSSLIVFGAGMIFGLLMARR